MGINFEWDNKEQKKKKGKEGGTVHYVTEGVSVEQRTSTV